MAKSNKGRKGNKSTRHSKIGNTSWRKAEMRGLIDDSGRELSAEKKAEFKENLRKIQEKIKELQFETGTANG